jgi:GNAT superfamily N-acetyltransferase
MISSLAPAAVDAETASRDFWARYHAYRRIRQAETRPDEPLKPDALVETGMKRNDPFNIVYRYEMVRDGEMVGWFEASTSSPASPEYDTNKHILWAHASVHRDHRRQGIGRKWIPLALDLMDRHGCTTLSMNTEEESGHSFLKWMGAEAKMGDLESRLEMSAVDWTMVSRWVADASKLSPTTKLEVYDGHLPEEMWEDYCPQFTTMLNTMPFEQLDIGDIIVTPPMLAEWYARRDIDGVKEHTMLTREPDGVISGITDMNYAPYRPKFIQQGFTGVRPDARGRGLGKWLKAAMLLHVHKIYPEVKWAVTQNAGSNAPMLGINIKLGFKKYVASSEYQITRDEVRRAAGPLHPRLRRGGPATP